VRIARSWRIASALLAAALVTVACNAILDNKDAEFTTTDAGCSTGYLCGRLCVQPGDPAYGCQIGAACQACPGIAHGTRGCDDTGSCTTAACDPHYAHCDSSPEGGCETNTATDPSHCGGCDNACPPGVACVDGGCAASCVPPNTACVDGCFDLSSDPDHCGASCPGYPCPPVGPNAYSVCTYGTCTIGCDEPGTTLCAGATGPPFCTDTRTDPKNCGTCGVTCGAGCLEGRCCIPGPNGCCFPPKTPENCVVENFCCSGACDPNNNVCL
jgi:hypothetical protein